MSNSKKSPVKSRWRLLVLLVVLLIIFAQSIGVPVAAHTAAPVKATETQQRLTTAERNTALTQLAKVLAEHYVLPERAAQLALALLQAEAAGRFHHLQSKQQLVDEVGHWLRSVGKDGHLGLELTQNYGEVTYIRHETEEKRRNNFAFEKLEIMPGNIGYLKLNKFVQADAAFDVAAQALQFLSRTDALIIDLRESAGGSPELVRYLLSFFVPAETLLWQLESRSTNQPEDIRAQVVLQKQLQMPLYVLQSANQVSAAEFFSYALQQQGRATVIGETSAGLAHYTGAMAVTDWLFVRIPLARPVFPQSGDNFEQRGVVPDVQVPAVQALQQALALTQQRRVN
ncbi:S41 family peptidase [Rheinheimera texasensis]|uniref:S41 family peptidase n=1 Tax=Rheinheimera texasensis TaxID=306205 RepID=UPI0004E1504A|nr:S41 family peptidase [Rheinheimera texasensis]